MSNWQRQRKMEINGGDAHFNIALFIIIKCFKHTENYR